MNGAVLTTAIRDFGTNKEVARVVGCSEDTAARYRRGETSPDPLSLARLMSRSRAITSALLRLAGLDDLSMDLEEARLIRELRLLQAKREVPNAEADAAPGSPPRTLVACRDRLVNRLADQATARMKRALDDVERLRP
jgi:transcriptional regulator with XRE-family HTH domain